MIECIYLIVDGFVITLKVLDISMWASILFFCLGPTNIRGGPVQEICQNWSHAFGSQHGEDI